MLLLAAPTDPQVLKAINNLVNFVAKHGESFEVAVLNKNVNNPIFE